MLSNEQLFEGEITKPVSTRYIFDGTKAIYGKLPLLVYLHPAGGGYCTNYGSLLVSDIPRSFKQKYHYLHPLCDSGKIFKSDDIYGLIETLCEQNPNIDRNRIYGVGYS